MSTRAQILQLNELGSLHLSKQADDFLLLKAYKQGIREGVPAIKPDLIPNKLVRNCFLTDAQFSWSYHKHHCRCCGKIFCQEAITAKVPMPHLIEDGAMQKVCVLCEKRFVGEDIMLVSPCKTELVAVMIDAVAKHYGGIKSTFHDDLEIVHLAPKHEELMAFTTGRTITKLNFVEDTSLPAGSHVMDPPSEQPKAAGTGKAEPAGRSTYTTTVYTVRVPEGLPEDTIMIQKPTSSKKGGKKVADIAVKAGAKGVNKAQTKKNAYHLPGNQHGMSMSDGVIMSNSPQHMAKKHENAQARQKYMDETESHAAEDETDCS